MPAGEPLQLDCSTADQTDMKLEEDGTSVKSEVDGDDDNEVILMEIPTVESGDAGSDPQRGMKRKRKGRKPKKGKFKKNYV